MANLKPLTRNKNDDWETTEINYLKKYFPVRSTADVATRLNKTFNAVRSKAGSLKLKKQNRYWTGDQEKFILKNWERLTVNELAKHVDKTTWAVYAKHRELLLTNNKE